MNRYEEFQQIMAKIKRKRDLENLKNGNTSSLDFLKNMFEI